jgi:histidine ammonia-lyase
MNESDSQQVVFGDRYLSVEDVCDLARRRRQPSLTTNALLRQLWERGAAVVEARLRDGIPTYGVNTGFGGASGNIVPVSLAAELVANLPRFHSCGVGPILPAELGRAVLAARLASLVRGQSGVRVLLLESVCALLARDVVPCIPARGSVGASGDLTPLAYVAMLLTGEGRAFYRGNILPACDALAAAGLRPLSLVPKESLALMNGTSVMTALACVAHARAATVARLGAAVTAMVVDATRGQASHYDARLAFAKPHAGQITAAAWIRADLGVGEHPAQRAGRIQDRYSLRCAPHVLGVLVDVLTFSRSIVETELNSASDNPLVDPESGDVLHGGNFYGGHIAAVADMLKAAIANVGELLERQLVLLQDPGANGGLPANLVAVAGPGRVVHHGWKAMEIVASALVAEACKLTMPASAFSRSTEGHNQDKTSMGTIAARDCLEILDLTESVTIIALLAACQAVELRGLRAVGPSARLLHARVREHVTFVTTDRAMDADIAAIRSLLDAGRLNDGLPRMTAEP